MIIFIICPRYNAAGFASTRNTATFEVLNFIFLFYDFLKYIKYNQTISIITEKSVKKTAGFKDYWKEKSEMPLNKIGERKQVKIDSSVACSKIGSKGTSNGSAIHVHK